MSQEQSPNFGDALRLWEKRLKHLEKEKAINANPLLDYELIHRIEECRKEIQRLKNDTIFWHEETRASTDKGSKESDPKLIYRQKVYELLLANNGEITLVRGELLTLLRDNLRLQREEAEICEAEAFLIYRNYQSKLRLFENLLREKISYVFFEE
jgi:hypothetical protein